MRIIRFFILSLFLSSTILAKNTYKIESMLVNPTALGFNDALLVNDSCILVCGDKGSIKRSIDKGNKFELVRCKYSYDDLSGIAMNANGKIFCSTKSGNLIISTDQGLTWQEINLNNPSAFQDIYFWDNMGFMPTDDKELMLSKDNGETWNTIDFNFPGRINSIEKISNNFYAADSVGNLWKSADGENWQIELTHNRSCNNLFAINDYKLLIAYNNGRIIEYIPSESKTIELPKLDTFNNILQAVRLNDTTDLMITINRELNTENEYYRYNTDEWKPVIYNPTGIDKIIYYRNAKLGIGVGYFGTIKIGGDTLVYQPGFDRAFQYGRFRSGSDADTNYYHNQLIHLSASNDNEFVAINESQSNSILISKDSCQSFERIELIEPMSAKVVFAHKIDTDKYIICIDTTTKYVNGIAKKKSRFYLYSQKQLTQVYETEVEQNVDGFVIADSVMIFYRLENIYLSKNYGAEWVKLNTPNNMIIDQITIDRENKLRLIAKKKIYTSANYCGSWELVDSVPKYIDSFVVMDSGQYLGISSSRVGNTCPYSLYINNPNTKEWKSIYQGVVNNYSSCFNIIKLKDDKVVLISNNDMILISDNFTKCERLNGNRSFFIFDFVSSVKVDDNTIYLCSSDSIYRIKLSLDATADVPSEIIGDDITIDSQTSSGAFTIRSTEAKLLESIEVFDQNGLSIARINNIHSNTYQLNTELLSAGLYILKIKSDGKEFHKKILKF